MSIKDLIAARREEIETSSPTHVVVMLYDEAINQLELSLKAIMTRDVAARCNAVTLTAEIVEHLHTSLDFEAGGTVARQLGAVYRFIMRQLPRINFYNDAETAAQIVAMLEQLRDSWLALDRQRAAEAKPVEEHRIAAVA